MCRNEQHEPGTLTQMARIQWHSLLTLQLCHFSGLKAHLFHRFMLIVKFQGHSPMKRRHSFFCVISAWFDSNRRERQERWDREGRTFSKGLCIGTYAVQIKIIIILLLLLLLHGTCSRCLHKHHELLYKTTCTNVPWLWDMVPLGCLHRLSLQCVGEMGVDTDSNT